MTSQDHTVHRWWDRSNNNEGVCSCFLFVQLYWHRVLPQSFYHAHIMGGEAEAGRCHPGREQGLELRPVGF